MFLNRIVPQRRHRTGLFLAAAAFAGVWAQAALTQTETAPKVTIAAAYARDITEEAQFIGRGEAVDKVGIVARVKGFLKEKAAADGSQVEAGQLLFRIEPDLYQATLDARRADLDRAEAHLELAKVELDRKSELLSRGSVPQSEVDVAKANELVAEAEVKAANAAIQQAELDLGYTEITAPFPGRLGRTAVSVGDVVGQGGETLATLVREAPVFVSFSLTEKQLATVMETVGANAETLPEAEQTPDVYVTLPNGTELPEAGQIVFVDNRIDPRTGAIAIRAQFANEKRLIIDGNFLKVRIQALEPTRRVLIPQAALQRDQRGEFVLVVTDKQLVEQRYVQTGDRIEAEVIVLEGLQEGESVIVEGLQRVRPGAAVDAVVAGTGN